MGKGKGEDQGNKSARAVEEEMMVQKEERKRMLREEMDTLLKSLAPYQDLLKELGECLDFHMSTIGRSMVKKAFHHMESDEMECDLSLEGMFRNNIEKYKRRAKKALQHFNSIEGTDFEVVEVKFGCTEVCPEIFVRINFLAQPVGGGAVELFYAELKEVKGKVDETYLSGIAFEVQGCCLLKRRVSDGDEQDTLCDSSNMIYPLPEFGYEVAAGNRYNGFRFEK